MQRRGMLHLIKVRKTVPLGLILYRFTPKQPEISSVKLVKIG